MSIRATARRGAAGLLAAMGVVLSGAALAGAQTGAQGEDQEEAIRETGTAGGVLGWPAVGCEAKDGGSPVPTWQ